MLADPNEVEVAAAPSLLPSAAEHRTCMYAVVILEDVSNRASASIVSDPYSEVISIQK